jgi:hypothetical protein
LVVLWEELVEDFLVLGVLEDEAERGNRRELIPVGAFSDPF